MMFKNRFLKSWYRKNILKLKHWYFLVHPAIKKRNTVILGVLEDAFSIPDNFDEPLPEDIINDFYTDKL